MKRTIYALGIFSFFCLQTVISQDTIVLQPGPEGKDAIINTYLPGESRPDYQLFRSMAWTHSGTPAVHRCLIGWDLSILPPGTVILDARLDLSFATWAPNYESHTGENASYLLRITEPWVENEITWNNQPETTWDDVITLPQSITPDQDYPNIDVTAQIQQMVSDPENNHGVLLRLVTEEYYRCMLFASSDYPDSDKRPRLRIIYMGCLAPTVDFEYQANGQSVNFSGISLTATEWHWDFGDGDTSNVQDPVHIYEESGNYQVCLTVEDTCYFAEYCEEIEICTGRPVAGFNFIVNERTVVFQDTTDFATEFYWDFGDGYFSSQQNPFHTYSINGQYQVCLTAGNSCGSDTSCQWLDICTPPVSEFYYYMDGYSVQFLDISENAEGYFWDFGDGYYSNLVDPWHEYESPGDYNICLTTMNNCGADTICDVLHLSTVSIPESREESFVIYPNPARDKVFIQLAVYGEVEISLFDPSGKEVLHQNREAAVDEPVTLDITGVIPGIYFVRMISDTDISMQKLLITK